MIKNEGETQFRATAALLGLETDHGMELPQVRGGAKNLAETAKTVGDVICQKDIFRANGELVWFDHEGERQVMTPATFRTWITQHLMVAVRYDKETGDAQAGTFSNDEASTILASPFFRQGVRPIRGTQRVRLPVIRQDGTLDRLPWGYDTDTGIYTVPGGLDYALDMPLEVAKGHWQRAFATFPFADDRSKAVQVAAMLSLFVRCLPGGSSLRPGFLWLANKPESGKSVLAKACQYPVLGKAPVAKMKRHEDLDKEMEAFMRAGVASVFIDNIYSNFQSHTIDQLLTSEDSTGRAMGGHGIFEARNQAQFFLTGNSLELNEDAERRFLVVDLFEAGDPRERGIPDDGILSDERMRSDDWRRTMLAMMWAFVRHWHEMGCPQGSHRMGSFERFSLLLGGIVEAAGYASPCQRAIIPDAINPEKQEFLQLLEACIEEMGLETSRDFTLVQLCHLSRLHSLYEARVGTLAEGIKATIREDGIALEYRATAEDRGIMTRNQQTAFATELKKQVGQKPVVRGQVVEFGKRAQARNSTWTITRL